MVPPIERPTPRPRHPHLPFSTEIPRHWLRGSVLGTALGNSLNLLFPWGERMFIRSVRAYADRIHDPLLREQVRGFMAQEVRHACEHEQFFETIEAQGFAIRGFLAVYEKRAARLEALTPRLLRLAVTVALEHFTAMFAERALARPLLDEVHPVMQDLLRWHAAEEIEHKCVAF